MSKYTDKLMTMASTVTAGRIGWLASKSLSIVDDYMLLGPSRRRVNFFGIEVHEVLVRLFVSSACSEDVWKPISRDDRIFLDGRRSFEQAAVRFVRGDDEVVDKEKAVSAIRRAHLDFGCF